MQKIFGASDQRFETNLFREHVGFRKGIFWGKQSDDSVGNIEKGVAPIRLPRFLLERA